MVTCCFLALKPYKEYRGYGVKNIKKVVEKYNGIIEYFEKDGELCCDILEIV